MVDEELRTAVLPIHGSCRQSANSKHLRSQLPQPTCVLYFTSSAKLPLGGTDDLTDVHSNCGGQCCWASDREVLLGLQIVTEMERQTGFPSLGEGALDLNIRIFYIHHNTLELLFIIFLQICRPFCKSHHVQDTGNSAPWNRNTEPPGKLPTCSSGFLFPSLLFKETASLNLVFVTPVQLYNPTPHIYVINTGEQHMIVKK